jgi:diguanylate cyclase (GGDEF)-like protein
VLRAVAERTRGCVRDADTVARIGGDEFALLLSGTGQAEAGAVLQKIVAANAVPVPFEGRALPASVSLGACAYRGRDADLLKLADSKMYEAKRAGGNRYVL